MSKNGGVRSDSTSSLEARASLRLVKSSREDARGRLLFLTRPFPPLRATSCVRTWNLTKYLSRLGWKITVVTPHPSVWTDTEDLGRFQAKLAAEEIDVLHTSHRLRFLAPDLMKTPPHLVYRLFGGILRRIARKLDLDNGLGWIRPIHRACSHLRPGDVDLVLATASPFSSFRAAADLAERLECPYVLDYRDPWSGNPHSKGPDWRAKERNLLSGARAVTTVSPSWREALDKRYGVGGKTEVVSNGYDPEELEEISPRSFDDFSLVYAGRFYPPKRSIGPVFRALQQLQRERFRNWRFHYFGNHSSHVEEHAKRYGLGDRVICHGSVSRREALASVKGASLTVIISSVQKRATLEEKGIVTGKVFETMGLGSRILALSPRDSDLEKLIKETRSGASFPGHAVGQIAAFIRCEAESRGTALSSHPEVYSWPKLAESMHSTLYEALLQPSDRKIANDVA